MRLKSLLKSQGTILSTLCPLRLVRPRYSDIVDFKPFKIAAFPDLIAKDAILAITSGRASKMISRTPIGQLTRSRIRPSSNRVLKDILPTEPYRGQQGVVHHSGKNRGLKVDKEPRLF